MRDLDTVPEWGVATSVGLPDTLAPGAEETRFEHPALHFVADTLLLAAVGWADDQTFAVLASSSDLGLTWTLLGTLDIPFPLSPHLQPTWLDDQPVFGAQDVEGGTSVLCRGLPSQATTCIDAGSARVRRILEDQGSLWAVLDQGERDWTTREFSPEEFGGGRLPVR